MKNIIKFLSFILLVSITIISCDKDETTFKSLEFPMDAFIAFDKTSSSIPENATTPIELLVYYSNTNSQKEDVSVDFTIASTNGAVEGIDYTIVDNKSSFSFSPSNGNYSDTVKILPIDNEVLGDANKEITLILGNSTYSIGFPGPDGLGKSNTLTIMDDDCAKEDALGIYEGDWLGTDSCGDYTDVTAKLTLPCGNGITIKGIGYSWLEDPSYWGEKVITEYDVLITIDAEAGTVTIPEQLYVTTLYNGDNYDYTIVGEGTIDTSGSKPVITLNYDMLNADLGSMANDYAGTSCATLFQTTITLQ